LGADLIYSIKSYRHTFHTALYPGGISLPYGVDYMVIRYTPRYHYLELPIKIGYTVGKKWNYFINGGVAPGIHVLLKVKEVATYYPSEEVSKQTFKGTDRVRLPYSFDAILETGVGYTFGKFFVHASVDGRCSILRLNEIWLLHDGRVDRYYSFGFNIGVKYKIR
jgi:hypothetical protein